METYDAENFEPVDPDTRSQEANDRVQALHQVIDHLGAFNRALLVLHLAGYRNAEIGEILGITATNVSTRLSRVRERLRTELVPPSSASHKL